MIESKDFVKEVYDIDTNHPDLLVIEETAWSVIQSFFAQGSAEVNLQHLNI